MVSSHPVCSLASLFKVIWKMPQPLNNVSLSQGPRARENQARSSAVALVESVGLLLSGQGPVDRSFMAQPSNQRHLVKDALKRVEHFGVQHWLEHFQIDPQKSSRSRAAASKGWLEFDQRSGWASKTRSIDIRVMVSPSHGIRYGSPIQKEKLFLPSFQPRKGLSEYLTTSSLANPLLKRKPMSLFANLIENAKQVYGGDNTKTSTVQLKHMPGTVCRYSDLSSINTPSGTAIQAAFIAFSHTLFTPLRLQHILTLMPDLGPGINPGVRLTRLFVLSIGEIYDDMAKGKELTGKDNGENIMKSIKEGPFQMGTVSDVVTGGTEGAVQQGPVRARVLNDLSAKKMKETFGTNVKMISWKVADLTKDDRESQLYDEFEHFRQIKGDYSFGHQIMIFGTSVDAPVSWYQQIIQISSTTNEPSPADKLSQWTQEFPYRNLIENKLALSLNRTDHIFQTNQSTYSSSNAEQSYGQGETGNCGSRCLGRYNGD
ncbi:hypothetical protein Tco_0799432 [Tanacetum coccineum]|uniref:Uncharacterized protein n=1 Tax=Tanacetum coccineum TaxID=301880 RepID=A0ABQ4ZQA8_9ASTR